ncbi:MAG: PHP-associated domain-containing protein [Haloferacaceae archaeon]
MTGGEETRVDLHVKTLDERVVERAANRGVDVLVYAPHFTRLPAIRERADQFSTDEVLVVPGREVFTGAWHDRRHLLAVDPDEPIPDFVTFGGALAALRGQETAVLVPHPGFANVSLDANDVGQHAEAIHAVETHNTKLLPYQNRRARQIARETGVPGFASSYAHRRATVGEAWTAFDRPVDCATDLVTALREGAPRRAMRRRGLRTTARSLVEFAHLGSENTWGKVDRVLLSGMEATHPGHVAYEGRFDDVRVY